MIIDRQWPWFLTLLAWLAVPSPLRAQEDIIDTFTHAKSQTVDVGSYTVHLLTVNNPDSRFDKVTALWMQIPIRGVQLSIENIGQQGKSNEIYKKSSSGDELVVLSAGFHDSNNKPVGLFVSHGETISSLARWTSGGILYQRRNSFGIVPIAQWNPSFTDLEYAVQAKPLVAENGHNGILAVDDLRFDRVGIGFTNTGDLLVCGAFNSETYRALSLYDFGRLMTATGLDGITGGRTILGLEGGPGAHIYFPGLERHFGVSGSDFVMNAIHVRHR